MNRKINTVIFALSVTILNLASCGIDKSSPEYVAEQFLITCKNRDWKEMKKYTTPESDLGVDMREALESDFGVTEIRNIKCQVFEKKYATCTFCCTKDTTWTEIKMVKTKKEGWLITFPKEPLPPEDY